MEKGAEKIYYRLEHVKLIPISQLTIRTGMCRNLIRMRNRLERTFHSHLSFFLLKVLEYETISKLFQFLLQENLLTELKIFSFVTIITSLHNLDLSQTKKLRTWSWRWSKLSPRVATITAKTVSNKISDLHVIIDKINLNKIKIVLSFFVMQT